MEDLLPADGVRGRPGPGGDLAPPGAQLLAAGEGVAYETKRAPWISWVTASAERTTGTGASRKEMVEQEMVEQEMVEQMVKKLD